MATDRVAGDIPATSRSPRSTAPSSRSPAFTCALLRARSPEAPRPGPPCRACGRRREPRWHRVASPLRGATHRESAGMAWAANLRRGDVPRPRLAPVKVARAFTKASVTPRDRRLGKGASTQGLACRPSAMSRNGLLTHRMLVFTGRTWNRVVLLSYFPTSAVKRRLVPTGTLPGELLAGK